MSNSTMVICDNGHVYDMSGITASPAQRAAISWCPKIENGKECGARVVWRNPIKYVDK